MIFRSILSGSTIHYHGLIHSAVKDVQWRILSLIHI